MRWWAAPALAAAATATACAAADTPEAQAARGAAVYAQACRSCHEVDGGIGVRLSDRVIASYGTGRRLFDYLRLAMPYGAPGSLDERAYWDVVAYLAAGRGARTLPVVVDSGTATFDLTPAAPDP